MNSPCANLWSSRRWGSPGVGDPASRASNTVEVFNQDDFGTFVADEVVLVDDTIYRIMAPFTLSKGGLVIPVGATIEFQGSGQQINDITYVNANKPFLRGDAVDALKWTSVRVIFVSVTQKLFDLTGAGSGPLQMQYGVFVGVANAGAGHITGFLSCVMRDTAFVGVPQWTDELLIKDTDTLITDSGYFNSTTSNGALFAVESTSPHTFEFVNCRTIPLAGESAFRISSGIQDAASRVVTRDIITNALGDLFDSSGLDELDPRVTSLGNFGRASSGVTIEGNLDMNALGTDIPAAQAWVKVNGGTGWAFEDGNRLVGVTDGIVQFIGLEPGTLKLDGNVILEPAVGTKALSASFVKICKEDVAVTFNNALDEITAAGLSTGDSVTFEFTPGTIPAALRTDVIYFIVNSNQLSYTLGGAVVTFADNGSGSNTVDHVEFHGSRSANAISKNTPEEVVVQALARFSPLDYFGQYVSNRDDSINVEVTTSYTRAFD